MTDTIDQDLENEIVEVLDQAWEKIAEARELIRYATGLVGNPTEAARWRVTDHFLRRWQADTMQVAAAWDKSPTGKEVAAKHE